MWPFKCKPKTSDQEKVCRLSTAVSEFNEALRDCESAGLSTYIKVLYSLTGSVETTMWKGQRLRFNGEATKTDVSHISC